LQNHACAGEYAGKQMTLDELFQVPLLFGRLLRWGELVRW
jgi:hypothetical protein